MLAGGPAPDADLSKVLIRRGTDVIWNALDTRNALRRSSPDRLNPGERPDGDRAAGARVTGFRSFRQFRLFSPWPFSPFPG